MFFIIYKTTCLINNKFYIGMHKTSKLDDGYLGSGKLISRSIRKYGKDNFKREILHYCNSIEEMKLKETEIVTLELLKDPLCMNLTCGGYGGFYYVNENGHCPLMNSDLNVRREMGKRGYKAVIEKMEMNQEFKEYFERRKSDALKESWRRRDKNVLLLHLGFNGRKHSDESKNKISESMKQSQSGQKNSQYGTCWVTKDGQNKKIKKEDLQSWVDQGWRRGRK